MTHEKDIVKKIKEVLEGKYPRAFIFKTHGGAFQRLGLPDLIACINGRFIAVEVKLPGKENTLTKIQQATLKLLHRAGAICFMTTSVDHTYKNILNALGGKEIDPFELFNGDSSLPETPKKK